MSNKNNLLEILTKSLVSPDQKELLKFIEAWKNKVKKGVRFPRLDWVNELIEQLPLQQINILSKKFERITDFYQMQDLFAELFVAALYKDKHPIFCPINKTNKTPDLFLQKTGTYIEVKVINSSDYSHNFENYIFENSAPGIPVMGEEYPFTRSEVRKKILPKLICKVIEKVTHGKKQLEGKNGFIYLLYRIDEVTDIFGRDIDGIPFDLKEFINLELTNFIKHYSYEQNIKVVFKPYDLLHFRSL